MIHRLNISHVFHTRMTKTAHLIYMCACAFALVMTGCAKQPATELTILHTNDTHSQVEPTNPNSRKDADMGGYARRMGLIEQERAKNADLLLFDAGDFSQGTPYFNFYRGRIEIEAMNRMGYDAATLGNHEFDNGLDTLAMLLRTAQFPFVCANYDVAGTPLEGLMQPYTVIERAGLKIGVFGLGVSPVDLIATDKFGGINYLDPLQVINETADLLRNRMKCDVVVCLSHLGTDNSNGTSDLAMAAASRNVDVFIGGHTHHVFENERVTDLDGHEVVVAQAGKAGMRVGKIQLHLAAAENE